ncbi:Os03g0441601, partial [Oryza sativa Japonica Group]
SWRRPASSFLGPYTLGLRWEHWSWVTEAHGGISAKLKHLHSICSLALSWLLLFILRKTTELYPF